MWVVGIWGPAAKLSDAALPPPYTKEFFLARLGQWVGSLQPLIIGPLIVVAVVSTILMARRERKPAGTYEIVSIWWMLPFLGCFTFLTSAVVPYYRFMNATAAVMPLTALGAFVAIRWFLRADGAKRAAGILASVAIVGAFGLGLLRRFVEPVGQREGAVDRRGCADLTRRRPRGGGRSGRAPQRIHRQLRRHRHGLRLGQDVHQHHADGPAGRSGAVLGHLLRHARELPGRPTHGRRGRGVHADLQGLLRGGAGAGRQVHG